MNNTIQLSGIMQGKDYPSAGTAFYDALSAFIPDHKVVVDVRGVDLLPSMFLTMSIGKIIKENGGTDALKSITFINITKAQVERLKDYIDKVSRI